MDFKAKLQGLLRDNEIQIIDVYEGGAEVLLPYSEVPVDIDIEGDTEEERIESFKSGVNYELVQMINHLRDYLFQ